MPNFTFNELKLLTKVLTEYKHENLHDIDDRTLKKHVNRLLTKIREIEQLKKENKERD